MIIKNNMDGMVNILLPALPALIRDQKRAIIDKAIIEIRKSLDEQVEPFILKNLQAYESLSENGENGVSIKIDLTKPSLEEPGTPYS